MSNYRMKTLLLSTIVVFTILEINHLSLAQNFNLSPKSDRVIKQQNNKSSIEVYSITLNRHGRVIKTSVGTFYLGRSGDAIHQVSRNKRYGYWEGNEYRIRVYIADDIYTFYLD